MSANPALWRRLSSELLGSAAMALAVVGSGIAAQRLSPHDTGLQLAENAAATGLALFVIILVLAPISGAHLNPVVSLVDAIADHRPWRDVAGYIPAQIVGCVVGAVTANVIFAAPAISISHADRLTWPHALAEVIATAGLVLVIFVLARTGNHRHVPTAVGAYIAAAYFFTSSTSFANPAITLGRIFTDSFAGIAPTSALGFIGAQLIGAAVGLLMLATVLPSPRSIGPLSNPA